MRHALPRRPLRWYKGVLNVLGGVLLITDTNKNICYLRAKNMTLSRLRLTRKLASCYHLHLIERNKNELVQVQRVNHIW